MQTNEIFQLQTITGSPVQTGEVIVAPQSQALIVRLPFGGLVWHRPTAVLVEREGQTSRVPIVDATRVIQLALLGAAACAIAIAALARIGERRKDHEQRNG